MNVQEVKAAMDEGVIPLDMRTPRPFAEKHLPGAVNIQFNRADLADRAGLVLPRDAAYLVHAEPDPIARVAAKLLQEAGFQIRGHLEGGLRAWEAAGQATETLAVLDVDELHDQLHDVRVLDVREGFEFRHAHIPRARSLPWAETWTAENELRGDGPLAVVCGDEVRSAAAASILKRSGHQAALVLGGMIDWLEREYPTEKGA